MKKTGNRLKSEEGASLAAALLFFVLCGVGASVILAAASASAGKMQRLPETDQKRFAVESAAAFLRDEMRDSQNKITITDVKVEDSRDNKSTAYPTLTYLYSDKTALDPARNMIDACVVELYRTLQQDEENAPQQEKAEKDFLMSVRKKGSTQYYDQLEARVKLTMDSDYHITAILSDTQTDDTRKEDRCERKLTIPAKTETEETVEEKDYERTGPDGDVEEEWTITTTTRVTTICWERGLIERTHPDGDEHPDTSGGHIRMETGIRETGGEADAAAFIPNISCEITVPQGRNPDGAFSLCAGDRSCAYHVCLGTHGGEEDAGRWRSDHKPVLCRPEPAGAGGFCGFRFRRL